MSEYPNILGIPLQLIRKLHSSKKSWDVPGCPRSYSWNVLSGNETSNYRIVGNVGEVFNLAIWRSRRKLPD